MFFSFLFTCSIFLQIKNEDCINEIKIHQFEQNMYFKTKGKSPLTESDLKNFIQHDFFKIDLNYRVVAT